jgi:hypothetical protein
MPSTSKGKETLVNGMMRDGRMVIDSIQQRLVFRIDKRQRDGDARPRRPRDGDVCPSRCRSAPDQRSQRAADGRARRAGRAGLGDRTE